MAAALVTGCGGDTEIHEPLPLVEATIADLQAAILDGRSSCRSIVQGYLDRIAAYDQPTGLNAISMVHPGALERADEIDAAIGRGDEPGPLFCAPILVKDNFDTHDLPTTAGSIVLADSLPVDDAFMVRRLREAGAIVLAKTNMAEWAFSPRQTVSSTRGVTANAYDRSRVPAGSSGGTASGVAASFGVAGMGSDTGNSIRGPSSRLGLFGIRSTLGLTSRDGVVPLLADWDVAGPMTRTVEDGARLFDVVADFDPSDPLVVELGEGRRAPDYLAFLDAQALSGARIGVLEVLVGGAEAEPEIVDLFRRAVDDLRSAGAVVVEDVTIANLREHLADDSACISFRHDLANYSRSLPTGRVIDLAEILEAGEFAESSLEAMQFYASYPIDGPPETWEPPCSRLPRNAARQSYRADVIEAMDIAGVEALVYPSWTTVAARLDRAVEDYAGDNSQIVSPPTGLPAVTVPMGHSEGGMPAGLQILGRPFSEGRLIALAYGYEQATRHRRPPPDYPELSPPGLGGGRP